MYIIIVEQVFFVFFFKNFILQSLLRSHHYIFKLTQTLLYMYCHYFEFYERTSSKIR